MSGVLDQYDRDRFKTVVNNELHTIHIEKNFHKHIVDKEFDEVFGQYSSINNIQRKQKECMENSPILFGILGILKCYTCITSLFQAFDWETWNYTFIVCYK